MLLVNFNNNNSNNNDNNNNGNNNNDNNNYNNNNCNSKKIDVLWLFDYFFYVLPYVLISYLINIHTPSCFFGRRV